MAPSIKIEDHTVKNYDKQLTSSHPHQHKNTDKDIGPKFGSRHIQMILCSLLMMIGMANRNNLSVAIVAMTDNSTSPNPDVPTYNWDNTSVILSSFYWSYIFMQAIAGYLGKTYGPKYFLLVTYSINCCAGALTPLAAEHWGSTGVMVCRIVQGLGQGFIFPSVNVLLGRWVPEQERSTLYNFAYAGVGLGTMAGSLITGYVSSSWWGWPASFYILSGIGFLWCIVWFFFGQNSPASHPTINPKERIYIQTSLKQGSNKDIPIPWKSILTCVPFYAIMATVTGNVWGSGVLSTELPTYLSKVMNFDVKSSALVSSLPTVGTFFFGLLTGVLSDWVISKKILSRLVARRVFNLIGASSQALCLLWLAFLTSSQATMSVAVYGVGHIMQSFVLIGSSVNHLDLSPRFAGIMFGIINTAAQFASILGPLSANWIVTDPTDVSQWKIVFLIAAGFFVLGSIIFFFFSSATRQPWDGPEEGEDEGDKNRKISVISLMSI